MPPLDEQINRADTFTADFTVTRALLTPGRSYKKPFRRSRPIRLCVNRIQRCGMRFVRCCSERKNAPNVRIYSSITGWKDSLPGLFWR